MNFDFRQGVYFTFSAIGALFCVSSILSPQFVGAIIFFLCAIFGWIHFRRSMIELQKREFENHIFEKHGRLWIVQGNVEEWTPEPPRTSAELEKTIETTEPVQTGFEGENPLLDMDRVGEYADRRIKIPDEIWPDEINLESEKVPYLAGLGFSKNAICFGVYGSKNGENMKKINEILGGS